MATYNPKHQAVITVVFDGFGQDDSKQQTFPCRVLSSTVGSNSAKEADTFELEVDYKSLPVSPDLIRNAGVSIFSYGGTSLNETAAEEAQARNKGNLAIAGLVDEATEHHDGGGSTLRLSGRDYTCIPLDRPWDSRIKIPVGQALSDTVQYLVDIAGNVKAIDATGHVTDTGKPRLLKVRAYEDADTMAADRHNATGKKPKAADIKAQFKKDHPELQPKRKGKAKAKVHVLTGGAHTKTNAKGIPHTGGGTSSFWDVIYKLVNEHALIVYVRGFDVVITNGNVLNEAARQSAQRMAYGRNLLSLEVNRKLGKETTPSIRCLSYDPQTRAVIQAEYPPSGSRKEKVNGLGVRKDEVQIVHVPAITDQGRLLDMAKARYDALARSEATIKFTTKDLASLNGGNLLQLRSGDPIAISFDDVYKQDPKTLNTARARSQLMRAQGYADTICNLVGKSYDDYIRQATYFYVKTVTVSYSGTDGFTIEVEAMNYISEFRDGSAT